MNISSIVIVTFVTTTLSTGILWQMEKVNTERLTGEINTLSAKFDQQLSQNQQLEKSLRTANKQFALQQELLKKHSDRVDEYHQQIAQIEQQKKELQSEIAQMRRDELEKAIQQPYERGNATASRWSSIMQRIAGETSQGG